MRQATGSRRGGSQIGNVGPGGDLRSILVGELVGQRHGLAASWIRAASGSTGPRRRSAFPASRPAAATTSSMRCGPSGFSSPAARSPPRCVPRWAIKSRRRAIRPSGRWSSPSGWRRPRGRPSDSGGRSGGNSDPPSRGSPTTSWMSRDLAEGRYTEVDSPPCGLCGRARVLRADTPMSGVRRTCAVSPQPPRPAGNRRTAPTPRTRGRKTGRPRRLSCPLST